MNITIGAAGRCIRTGTGKRGPWALYAVVDANQNEYRTWDADIGSAPVGAVMDVDMETQPGKDGYPPQTFLKKAINVPPKRGPSAPPKDSGDAAAIRRAVAFKGAIDIATALTGQGQTITLDHISAMLNVFDRMLAGERITQNKRSIPDDVPYDDIPAPDDLTRDPHDTKPEDPDNLPF